jgi:hypothetical protein
MPVLPISDGQSNQLETARWVTMSCMFYPSADMAAQREGFMACKLAERALLRQPDQYGNLSISHAWLKALLNAPSLKDVEHSLQRRNGGILAGLILYVVVQMYQHRPKDASIAKATDAVMSLSDPIPNFPLSRAHVKEQWRIYKPVSALWASLLYLHSFPGEPLEDLDQMSPNRFGLFLEIAEFFRKNGETIVAQRAEKFGPVLDGSSMWRFPEDLIIPDFSELLLPDPTDELIETIRKYRAPKRF